MTHLILRVESYRNQPPGAPLQAVFDAEGGSVGRAPGNRLVLDDPGKYISRSHASVTLRDGRYYLTDAGSNPSLVNQWPLGAGAEIALGDGDRIVIGDYVLVAMLEAPEPEPEPADATMLAPAPQVEPTLPLFEPPPAPVPPPLPPFEALLPPPAPLPPDVGEGLPDNMLAGARILDGTPIPAGDDVLADPLGLSLRGGVSAASRAAEPDHVSPELQAFAPPPAVPMAIPADYDPLADLRPRPAAPTPAPLREASAAASVNGDIVLRALLEGLGLPQLRACHAPEDLARLVGEMLRAATAGTMDVLRARALTKRESHIDMTMIAPRANNPLKFFPDVDSALSQMLSAQIPGYLPPLPAIGGAFDDLKAHELAVIAGMRAALAAVVQRFDPARIEQRLADPGRLDKLLPAGRKARMWDRLVELYGELARDADEDLQRLFGEKFSGAYAQQVERLRGEAASHLHPNTVSRHGME
ncbi:type VI secretion system-associated FHA domain protein TagH [Duganella sp. FT94W]|uniref:Type VI secretion system-associated FHA domain protein TagH n=1 Tax=Duganella lactea TaxID=2692173 RepID=A0ABW9V5L3_9BURK|nr:type VI secretion system-associated FHA domain protein TagH [Duganella lactea]MYM34976.1 type VI secretion system-associated FHA domain protein TagH [Duganella lactea]